MHSRSLILSFFFLFPVYMFASIEGIYFVEGRSPESSYFDYTTNLAIVKFEDVYLLEWFDSNEPYSFGTGVRKNNVLAVVWYGNSYIGVSEFFIDDDHLEGPWCAVGEVVAGYEKAKKIGDQILPFPIYSQVN